MTSKKAKDKKKTTETTNSVAKSDYTEEEKARIAKFLERSRKVPVKFKTGGKDSAGNPVLHLESDDFNLTFATVLESLGTADADLRNHLLNQVSRSFAEREEDLTKVCNIAMAILNGILPRDEIEGMLAVQMIGVHNVAMATLARSMISEQTFEGKQAAVNQSAKMLRTFTAQMEALKKYRTGGQQKVTVEHVHVNEGGQAIVGNVNQQGGGGSYGKKEE